MTVALQAQDTTYTFTITYDINPDNLPSEYDYVEPEIGSNELLIQLGFQNAMSGIQFHSNGIKWNHHHLIPQLSIRIGNQHVRSTLDLGAENVIGFETGRYFIFGAGVGYNAIKNSWLARVQIGGRIPLNLKHSHHFIFETGVQLNGIPNSPQIRNAQMHLGIVPIRLGLRFGLNK
jgi:hypothetical protein